MKAASLSKRFALWFVLVSLVPILLIGYSLLHAFETELRAAVAQQVSAVADKKIDQINDYLTEHLHEARIMLLGKTTRQAMDDLTQAFAQGVDSEIYRQTNERYRDYYSRFIGAADYYDLFLISPQGTVVYSHQHELDFATNLFTGPYRDTGLGMVARAALNTLSTSVSDLERYAPSRNATAIFIATPILQQGKLTGVLAIQLRTEHLFNEITDRTGLRNTGEVVVARREDAQTALVMAPLLHDPDAALARKLPLNSQHLATPMQRALNGERTTLFSFDYNGHYVVAASRYLPIMNWGMVAKMDADEALAPIYRMRSIALAIVVAALLIALLSAYLLGRRVVNPLQTLSQSAQRLADGNFTQRVTIAGDDELSALGDNFNAMAQRLQSSYADLEHQIEERTAALTLAMKNESASQDALKHERDFATNLINTAPVIVLLLDAQGMIQHVNPFFEQLTGYRLDEIKGKEWFSTFLPARDQDRIRALFQAATHDVSTRGNINPIIIRNGEEREIEWNARAIHDKDGTVTALLNVGQDVTERLTMDLALHTSAQRLNEAQRIAQVGSWELDLVNGTLLWSDEIFHLFEIDKAKFGATYEAFLNAIHPDDRDSVNKAYTDSLVTRSPYEIVHRLRMSDGRIKWVRERCASDFDSDGKPLRSIGTVQDITELKRVETALADSESLFRTLAEGAPVGIFRADTAGNCLYVNNRWCEMTGLSPESAQGMGWMSAIHAEDRARVIEEWTAAALAQQPFSSVYRFQKPDQSVIWVVGQARAEVDQHGTVLSFVGTITDITERINAEQALQYANEHLEERVKERTAELENAKDIAEQANAAKSQFLSRMSHELRTPMNAILGYAQILEADGGGEEVGYILKAGWHLLDLITDLLDFSKIEQNRLEVTLEDVAAEDIITECLATIRPMADEHQISLHSGVHACAVWLRADRMRLRQVLLNLLSNAVKYNREAGSVTLSCERLPNGRARIDVTDTGTGIQEHDLPLLFQPFSRLYLDTYAVEGSGIGLALSRQLMTLMGGTVTVTSTFGQGSTFSIELAEATTGAESMPEIATHSADTTQPGTQQRVVLYIEDSPMHISLVRDILANRPDIKIMAASTPTLGLELAVAHRPDLILLDINLPGLDGFEVMRRLRFYEATRDIPVVALSANAMPSDIERGRSAGFKEYVTKPIQVTVFRQLIGEILAEQKASSR